MSLDNPGDACCNDCDANEGGGAVLHARLAVEALAVKENQSAQSDDEAQTDEKNSEDHGDLLSLAFDLRCICS